MTSRIEAKRRWESEVDEFFLAPEAGPERPGRVSVLHLLRREIVETLVNLGAEGMMSEEEASIRAIVDPHRLFASTVLICTGIDLLATLSYGDAGSIGERFVKLLKKSNPGGDFTFVKARRVWALRNGLVHSFSLRPQSSGMQGGRRRRRAKPTFSNVRPRLTDVRLALSAQPLGGMIWRVGKRQWLFSVPDLFAVFRSLLMERRATFAGAHSSERHLVRTMMRRYGQITVGLQAPGRANTRRPLIG